MPPSESVQSSPAHDAGATSTALRDDLSVLIQLTLTNIRNKQVTLQESEHSPRRLRKQLNKLSKSIQKVEEFIHKRQLDPANLQDHEQDLAEIRSFVDRIKANVETPSDVSAKINRLNLRNGYELLGRLLDEIRAELRWARTTAEGVAPDRPMAASGDVAEIEQELALIQQTLNRQKQRLARDTLGTPLSSSIAKRLNRLAGLLHRIDGLSQRHPRPIKSSSRRAPIAFQLRPLVHQIDRAVDRLDSRDISAPDLLEETEVFVERQLHHYEYPLGAGWFVNRFSDIHRFRSPQAKVLLGLSSSLSVTLVIFLALLGLFSAISRGLETSVVKSLRLEQERNEELQTLNEQVTNLRQKETERTANQVALEEEYRQEAARAAGQNGLEGDRQPGANATGQTAIAAAEAQGTRSSPPPNTLGDQTNQDETNPDQSPVVRDSGSTVLETLQQKDQQLTSDIQTLRNTVDTQLIEISALNDQIEAAREAEQTTSDGAIVREETSLSDIRRVSSWLNNQQIINHLNRILLAAFAGALGSMMSILIRLDKLDDDNLNNPFALGFLKPFIGAVFGVIVFAVLSTKVIDILPAGFNIHEDAPAGSTTLQRRDPLGGIDSQEIYKIFVAAFIAGFSERLANDTLRSFK